MPLIEQPAPAHDDLDTDCPPLRIALAALSRNLANQLVSITAEFMAVSATPWQLLPVAKRLDGLRESVDYLRKEVGRLRPRDNNNNTNES